MDRNEYLGKYVKTFNDISLEADNLVESNGYNPIQFYAIILIYLNYYDHDNFKKIFEKLFAEKCDVLYEILLIYFSNFLKPINQNLDFFDKFIDYCVYTKELTLLEIGLNYIKDIEAFIKIVDKFKVKILDYIFIPTKSLKPIILKDNLELIKKEKNKEIKVIIDAIKSINDFSKKNNVLFIHFTSYFWIKILKEYNIPDDINIINCYNLREIFIEYNCLVNEIYKNNKQSIIKEDINKYFDRDEFAFVLDRNIEKLLSNEPELTNSEILGYIGTYNPYYKEERYKYIRSVHIFDRINLDDNNEQFNETFKLLNF
jgi:predicted RNA-binding protein with RPS1 domain